MANTSVNANLQVIKFRRDFFREYVRENRLAPYTGVGVDNPIVIKEDRGPTIRHPLLTRLKGAGVGGSDTLRGNGESIGNYSMDTFPSYFRHAVEFDKEQMEQTNIDLMRSARPLLMEWAKASCRDRQIQAMAAVYGSSTYANYADASEGVKDAWLAANTDRVIFGDTEYATSGGDHSAGLLTVDATASVFTGARVQDMRRLAEDADPHIRPLETDQESEVFVAFCGSQTFRDLKEDLTTNYSNADVRGMKMTRGGNILFRDGDLYWDGVIIRKVPEITKLFSATGKPLAAAGNGGTTVEPVFLCGAQALVWGLGQQPDIIIDRDFDYGFQPGVAVELKEDVRKAFFNGVQHGMVTGYFTGEA